MVSAYVVVQLAPTARAKRTRGGHSTLSHHLEHAALARDKVKQLLTEHGATVVSNPDPSTASDATTTCATIAVADMACADRLAAALRDMEGIETAYAKPGEELP